MLIKDDNENRVENPYLTGVCCINLDSEIEDEKIAAIFDTVEDLRNDCLLF